jgi:beta-lactam-binding protein with PASTA domain
VPDLFGTPLQTAFSTLSAANLPVGLILDALGKEVPRTPIPPEYQNVPVLAQLPVAGTRLDPAARVQLVVAATVTQPPIVTMPNLAGLTQGEAGRVLEQLGLRLGTVNIVRTP